MMLLQAYSIYDRKALLYHAPYFSVNDGAAIRSFSDAVNDTSNAIGLHPHDYVLYHVGTYSDQNGSLEPQSPVRHVVDAGALLKLAPQLPFPGPFSEKRPAVKPNGKRPVVKPSGAPLSDHEV